MSDKRDKFQFLRGKIISGRVYPEFFALSTSDRVINIGCGEGPQALVYARQYREMVGVDINRNRLERSREAMQLFETHNYMTLVAKVEHMPFRNEAFDKAIAVDIIEHVQSPHLLCREAHRILNPAGELLITFPAMHDKFNDLVSRLASVVRKHPKDKEKHGGWNPDTHNQSYSIGQWLDIIKGSGFTPTWAIQVFHISTAVRTSGAWDAAFSRARVTTSIW